MIALTSFLLDGVADSADADTDADAESDADAEAEADDDGFHSNRSTLLSSSRHRGVVLSLFDESI